MTDPASPGPDPEFGPSGYLPQRAAKRARKIVLRAPMGMHWIWGAVAVGVGVLVVGAIWLATKGGPPGPPYVELATVEQVAEGRRLAPDGIGEVHVSTKAGRIRVFAVDDDLPFTWCEASGRYEGPAGVWSSTGRGLGGTASLPEHPTVIVDGVLYWDPTTRLPGPVEDPAPVEPACT